MFTLEVSSNPGSVRTGANDDSHQIKSETIANCHIFTQLIYPCFYKMQNEILLLSVYVLFYIVAMLTWTFYRCSV